MVKMGTVWDRTAEFLTDNLPAILPILLFAYFVPFSVLGSLAPIMVDTQGLSLILWGIVFVLAALVTWGGLVLIAMALDLSGDPRRIAARRLAPALLVAVLMFGIVALLALPPILTILLSGSGIDGMEIDMPAAVAWAMALYIPLAIAAGVWIMARLILIKPAIVAEGRRLSAIPRSWMLTRGSGLRIVGVALLYFLVATVGMLATQLVFGSIFRLIAGAGEGLSLSNVLTSVMVAAAQTALSAVVPVFSAKLYQALSSATR